LCVGLGALAKGPPAWIPVGFAIVLFALLPRPFRFAPRRPLVAWIGFVVLALLPVATWAWLAIRTEPALARPLLFGQHVGRITKGDQHPGPIWDHLRSMPVLLLPWTFLFVAGAIAAWKSFRSRVNPGLVRIAAWFALVFVFFSIIPPKRDLYLLPIYPAAAMITAFAFDRELGSGRLRRWIAVPTAAVVVLAGLILAAAPFIVAAVIASEVPWLADVDDPARYARLCVPTGLLLVAAGVVALVGLARSGPKSWADAVGVGVACALTVAALVLVPAVDEDKSARALAALAAARPERPSVLACVGVRPEGIRFYGGGPAGGASPEKAPVHGLSIEELLERDGANFLALCRDKEFEGLPPDLRARLREVGRGRLGSRTVLLLVRAP
jgi:4-amino-4-deoxy-L-arabinose transferase-like glycosyltransferase